MKSQGVLWKLSKKLVQYIIHSLISIKNNNNFHKIMEIIFAL